MKKILSIILCLSLVLGLAVAASADTTLNVVAEGTNTADFSALTNNDDKDNSYAERASADGWTTSGVALNTSDWIGTTAAVLNGKVSVPGTLTSGTLTGGISSLSFNYGFPFGDSQFKITISVLQNGAVVASTTLEKTELEKETVYSHVWNLDTAVEGDYSIQIVNNCLGEQSGNKERLAIWNLTWNPVGSAPVETQPTETQAPTEAPKTTTANLVTELKAGDKVYIYYVNGSQVMSASANGSKMDVVKATADGTKLSVEEGAAVLTVSVDENGYYTFTCDGKYLTSGETGNSLCLADEASDYSLWALEAVEGGWYVKNVNSQYVYVDADGNETVYPQYLEFYNGFTTYSLKDSSNPAYYTFQFYAPVEADNSNAKTGDSISVFVALMAVSAMGIAVIGKKKF